MEAQLMVVNQNGCAEAQDPGIRNKFSIVAVEKAEDIKAAIWSNLRTIGRKGHVLVRWQNKLFVCELKQDGRGYTRNEVEYHPHAKRFTI